MRRRGFITLIGGLTASPLVWPLAARAQQGERVRIIGVLVAGALNDLENQARVAAFRQGLEERGWVDGRNSRIDIRWATANDIHRHATELVASTPDVLLAVSGTTTVLPLLQATRTVPIVFVTVIDPVGGGFVESLARPGGNVTGFMLYEYSISGKWLELLKELAPGVKRVAVFRESGLASMIGQFAAMQIVAPSFGVELRSIDVRDAGEIERDITSFGQSSNGGLIVPGTPGTLTHRKLIAALAAKHRLPAIYSGRIFAADGGLIAYGPDRLDQFRRAAGYVDRILKGENPAEMPVQAPTKYELIVNLRTAKALGLELPSALLARADEVIE